MTNSTKMATPDQPFLKWETAGEIAAKFVNGRSHIVDVRIYDDYFQETKSEILVLFFVLNSIEMFNQFAKLVKHSIGSNPWSGDARRVHRLRALNLIWGDLYPSWHTCTTYHGVPLENTVDVTVLPPNWSSRLTELCEFMSYGPPHYLQAQWDRADMLITKR